MPEGRKDASVRNWEKTLLRAYEDGAPFPVTVIQRNEHGSPQTAIMDQDGRERYILELPGEAPLGNLSERGVNVMLERSHISDEGWTVVES